MATELERLLVRIDATTEGLRRELKRTDKSITTTERKVNKATSDIEKSFKRLNQNIKGFGAGIAGALSVREIIRYSDSWKQLEGRLKVVTKSQKEFIQVQDGLTARAKNARAPLDEMAQLYTRISINSGEAIGSISKVMDVTEAASTAISITGESAASAQAALLQFAQALGTNFEAAGQEIRSIQEQAPRLEKAIIDGLVKTGVIADKTNVTLRTLANDGILNTANVSDALVSVLGDLQGELAKTQKTVGQAFTELDNAFLRFVGTNEAVVQGTSSLALGISTLADNFDVIGNVATVAALAIGTKYAVALGTAGTAQIAMLAGTVKLQVALGMMAGHSKLAATSMLGVAAATKAATLAFKAFLPLAAAGFIYELVDGNERLIETEIRLAEELGKTETQLQRNFDIHGELTEEAVAGVRERIEAYQKEIQALEILIAKDLEAIEKTGIIGATAASVYDTIANGAVEFFTDEEYTTLEEAVGLQTQYNKQIQGLNKLLDEFEKKEKPPGKKNELPKQTDKQKKYSSELQRSITNQKRLNDALAQSDAAYEKLRVAIDAENEAMKQGYQQGTEQFEQVKAMILEREKLAKAIDDTRDAREAELDQAQKQQEELSEALLEPWKDAFGDVQDSLADMLETGEVSIGRLTDFAKRAAAEMASAFIIDVTFRGNGGGGGGFVSNLLSGGSQSGGSGFGSIANIFSGGNSFAGGFGAVNQFGANYLGTGLPGMSGSLTSAGLSGILGGAGMGFGIGSMNLFGGNETGSTIGGTLGGAAGSIFGGPIGGAIGSAIGSAIGGLFGGGEKAKISQFVGTVGSEGGVNVLSTGTKGTSEDGANAVAQAYGDYLAALELALDLGIDDARVFGGTHSKAGTSIRTDFNAGVNEAEFFFDHNDPDSAEAAFAGLTKELINAVGTTDFLKEALAELEMQGMSTAEALETLAQEEANRQALASASQGVARGILSVLDPTGLAEMDERTRYANQLAMLNELGATEEQLRQAEILHQLQMQEIIEGTSQSISRMETISASFDDLIKELEYGQFSAQTPVANLATMESEVIRLAALARGGDLDAAEELRELLPAFLSLSEDVNGSNAKYAEDQQLAMDLSKEMKGLLDKQLGVHDAMLANSDIQTDTLLGIEALLQGYGTNTGNILASAAGNRLLRQGENPDALNRTNSLNNLSEQIVRGIKVSLGFDFSASENQDRSFKDYVNSVNPALGDEFNRLIVQAGGRAQNFNLGGQVIGQAGYDNVPANLTDGEFVMRKEAVQQIGLQRLNAMNSGGDKMDALIGVVSQLLAVTVASGDNMATSLGELTDEFGNMSRNAALLGSES